MEMNKEKANFSYTFCSLESDKINLFKSCLYQDIKLTDQLVAPNKIEKDPIDIGGDNLQVSITMEDTTNDPMVESIVSEHVAVPLTECQYHIHRAEAPYLPLTLTTYRAVAHKKFKAQLLEKVRNGVDVKIDQVSSEFAHRVDRELLDQQFFHVLVAQYHRKIQEHSLSNSDYHQLPGKIRENFEMIKVSEEYARLVQCIAEWFALMELCEDLIERIKLYGIAQYFDADALVQKLQ